MEDSVQGVAGRGNGNIMEMSKPLSPDLEQLTQDWRAFVADCDKLAMKANMPRPRTYIVDAFQPDMEAQHRARFAPAGRGARLLRVDRQAKAFIAA